jgi:uncharacterized peroxidase-related enzyme
MPFLPDLPPRASLLDVFKSYPASCGPLIAQHEPLLRGPSPLTVGQRELIAAYVSALNGCRYCREIHAAVAARLGIAAGLVDRLLEDPGAADTQLRPVIELARKLTVAPMTVRSADTEAVLAAGWGADGLYHAVAIVALFNQMNRLVEGLGIELEPGYLPVAATRLEQQGYAPLLAMIGRDGR